MLYSELNHLIRAARDVLNGEAVYIVGSQSIVPWLKKNEGIPPKSYNSCLTFSREADIIPFSGSEDGATEIDGSIGEDSLFDAMYGYYAQGVDFTTISAPSDWKSRCMPLTGTDGKTIAYCMHPIDLFITKSCAMREKMVRFWMR